MISSNLRNFLGDKSYDPIENDPRSTARLKDAVTLIAEEIQ